MCRVSSLSLRRTELHGVSHYLPSASCAQFICICFLPSSPFGQSAQENAHYSSLPISYLSCIKGVLPPLEWSVELQRPSFLFATLFSLFPSQNSSPEEFWSLQDFRCSDSLLISSTKTWEQHFPILLLCLASWSTLPHSFHFALFPLSVLCSKIPSPICLVLF
jgi:hypothetical protein